MLKSISLFIFFLSLVPHASSIVNLTIKETAGIARIDENMTMGVPLPENLNITDTSLLALRDETNSIIPCEIKKISTWYKTPSALRWVQLNFPFSINANASKQVTLSLESAPFVLSSKLSVVDNGTTFTINTGKVRFIVKKSNFNLLDQVWVDESGSESYSDINKVILTHARGIVHFKSDTAYTSSNDPTSTVFIERSGPGVITLKATGMLKNFSGSGTLGFVTRIYAFNNSATIKIFNTIENQNSDHQTSIPIQGIHLEMPLNLAGSPTTLIGTPGGSAQAALSGTQDAWCLIQRPVGAVSTMGSTMDGTFGGQITATSFKPIIRKPRDVGWVALYDNSKGCVAGMQYFWQMVPTSVEAFADGRIILGAFSKRSGQNPLPLYAGTARSCETEWTFFNSASATTLRSKAASITDRLYALASPFWYTRRTCGAVHMVERDSTLYTPSAWTALSAIENKISSVWNTILGADAGWLGFDSYGFLEWGDNPHFGNNMAAPCNVLWNGNYYGLDFFAFEHFFHTGDPQFLSYGISHARQVADVHQLHFGSGNPNTGSSRYCPPANHVGTENCNPDFGNMSHHKTEGLFLNYYLTGEDYSLQCALEGAAWSAAQNYSLAIGPSENISTYIRRWSNQLNDLIFAYEYNQSPSNFSKIWQNWEVFRKNIWTSDNPNGNTIGQPFMVGLAMETVVKMYYLLTPSYTTGGGTVKPDSIAHYLKIWCDRIASQPEGTESAQYNANVTIGYAFLAPFYGNSYLSSAAHKASLLPATPNNLHKDFVQQGRSIEMALYYFANQDSVRKYISVEKKKDNLISESDSLTILANPTPFNPGTAIQLTGLLLNTSPLIRLQVYSLDGKLIQDLSSQLDNKTHSCFWKPANPASNIFIIRCTLGKKTFSRRIVMLK